MKGLKKVFLIILLANILVLLLNCNIVYATGLNLQKLETDANSFITQGQDAAVGLTPVLTAVTQNFSGIGQILTVIGAGIMVAVTSYMGIQYLISPPDKQAQLKQQLIGLVAAGIVIFGAYGIWSAVLGVVQNF